MTQDNTQTPDYHYSVSGEGDFYEFQDVMDQLKDDGHEIGEKIIVFRGIKKKFDHSDFFNVNFMIECMQECAYDEIGEFAESYLDEMTVAKKGELHNHIMQWFKDNDIEVNFFGVENVEEIEIVIK